MYKPGTVERAYQLARSGKLTKLDDIVRQLNAEGYSGAVDHLHGASLRRELNGIMRKARTPATGTTSNQAMSTEAGPPGLSR